LAKFLGVSDPGQLQAIEAAALLHDMGKLAIPEHILNKPGKLSAAEFDKMKAHAEIGADLLSSIKFPYPVVPVVRHHHENWDGSGYPCGISGPDIPLGARILAVVDCFDALTSDRPYRPALTPHQAFQILLERRGTFYDPLVVDTFIREFDGISSKVAAAVGSAQVHFAATLAPAHLVESRTESFDSVDVECSCKAVASKSTPREAFQSAADCLHRLLPTAVSAYYEYNSQADRLKCSFKAGHQSELLNGLEMSLGDRVSGWTAATGTASLNSHATLDLRELADRFSPPLRSVLAVPLVAGNDLVGVFTLYSDLPDAFSHDHEVIASTLGRAFVMVLRRSHPHAPALSGTAVNS
jgi:putative nucleotidyltransferase with HDIG domain